jgi:hypothetical protein
MASQGEKARGYANRTHEFILDQMLLQNHEQGLFVRSRHHQVIFCASGTQRDILTKRHSEPDSDPEFAAGTIIYANDSPRKNRRSRSSALPQSRHAKRTRRREFRDDTRANAQRSKGSTK